MIIDHICYAVKNIPEALVYWDNIFGYKQLTEIVINERQKVKVTFMKKENSIMIKLIEPLEDNLTLKKFVATEGGFHHVCFRCDNVDEKVREMREKGLWVLAPPQPGEAFNNKDIAFILGKYGMNIELIDTDSKAGML